MRFSVIGPGSDRACRDMQACRVVHYARTGVTFADLTPAQVHQLQAWGFAVRPLRPVWSSQVEAPPAPPVVGPEIVSQTAFRESRWEELLLALEPPLTGKAVGVTIAVLDSGIRSTHLDLAGKVVYRANLSSSPTTEDVFGHGTSVAWLAAGGREDPSGFRGFSEPQGFAPGAWLMSIKVLGDDGAGTEETVVAGLEEVARLWDAHPPASLRVADPDPLRPNVVVLALGAPDDGDPNSPMRVALGPLFQRNIGIVAAAGNTGPDLGTMAVPATDPLALAVGAVGLDFQAPPWSSRGPTLEGLTKPDVAWFGANLVTASHRGDEAYHNVSGTSFAAAGAAGGASVLAEALARTSGLAPLAPELEQALPSITRKPADAPDLWGKDNIYGWGIPFGDLALKRVQEVGTAARTTAGVSEVVNVAAAGLALVALVPLLRGVARSLQGVR